MNWLRTLWLFIFFKRDQRETAQKYLDNAESIQALQRRLQESADKITDKKERVRFIAEIDDKVNRLRHDRFLIEQELRVARCTPEQLKRLRSKAK